MHKKLLFGLLLMGTLLSSCATVRQDEVGLRRRFGRLVPTVLGPGLHLVNPFSTMVVRVPTRTINLEVRLDLPSKEGLTIQSEISILYHLEREKIPSILESVGEDYEQNLILGVFRSATADVTANFLAKDMHSGERATIERKVQEKMAQLLIGRGFVIEAVLLKSIRLPQGLAQAIESKLEAEQEAMRMEFILQRERQEAERKKIEAMGTRDAQKILQEGLSKEIIQLRAIEAFRLLSTSPNAKVIVTDGRSPLIVNPEGK